MFVVDLCIYYQMKIAVFCSANEHIDPDFFGITEEMGKWMGKNQIGRASCRERV